MFRPEFLLPLKGPTGDVLSPAAIGALTTVVRLDRRTFEVAEERGYVREHGIAGYARQLGCSERSRTRATLDSAGVSAKACLSNPTVLEAKRLPAHASTPVSSVADDLGFAEATNFVRFFRRTAGCSPGEFRRQMAPQGAGPR